MVLLGELVAVAESAIGDDILGEFTGVFSPEDLVVLEPDIVCTSDNLSSVLFLEREGIVKLVIKLRDFLKGLSGAGTFSCAHAMASNLDFAERNFCLLTVDSPVFGG